MLQFITCHSEKYSLPEEAQMVIEGGCRWIQYSPLGLTEEEKRTYATQIIEVCRENDSFMIIENDVELTKELGAYGLHLSDKGTTPAEARELLGAEPIIGVTVMTLTDIMALRGVDVDYVTINIAYPCNNKDNKATELLENLSGLVKNARLQGCELPIVACGPFGMEGIKNVMATGVSGVALSSSILDSDDPVKFTAEIIAALQRD